jgi:hypothetical protein
VVALAHCGVAHAPAIADGACLLELASVPAKSVLPPVFFAKAEEGVEPVLDLTSSLACRGRPAVGAWTAARMPGVFPALTTK